MRAWPGFRRSRCTTRNWHVPDGDHARADLDIDDLVERIGASGMQLLMSFVRKGIRQEVVGNPVQAAQVASAILGI